MVTTINIIGLGTQTNKNM